MSGYLTRIDRLRIWDVATARVRKEIQGPAGTRRYVIVSPDGRRVAATAYPTRRRGLQSERLRRRVRRAAVLGRRLGPGLQPRRPLAGRPGRG